MKNVVKSIIFICVIFILAACGSTDSNNGKTEFISTSDLSINYTISNLTVTFDAVTSEIENIKSYSWDFGDTSSAENSSTSSKPVHRYSQNGEYTVTLTITDMKDNKYKAQTNIVINTTVNLNASFTYTVDGNKVTFTNTTTVNEGYTVEYSYDLGNNVVLNEANPVYTFASYGYHTATLTAKVKGTNVSATYTLPIKELEPTISFNAEVNGFNAVFTTTNKKLDGTLTYNWEFGDGTSSTEENPTHTYGAIQEYTVTLTVTSSSGYTVKETKNVYILGSYTIDKNFTYQVNTDTKTVSITNKTTVSPSGTLKYTYNFGDFSQPVTKTAHDTIEHKYNKFNSYTITIDIEVENTPVRESHTIYLNELAPSNYTLDIQDGSRQVTATFTGTNIGSNPTYSWDMGDGTTSDYLTDNTYTHTYENSGTYTLILTVYSDELDEPIVISDQVHVR